jgi:hypothetical protein
MAERVIIPVAVVLKLYARRFSTHDRGKTKSDDCHELEKRYGITKDYLIDRIYAGTYSISPVKDRR